MLVWGIIGVVGIVLTILVYLNPLEVVEMLGGRRRGGFAILGAFVIPPALIVAGIVFQFVTVRRYRVPGGGVIKSRDLFVVPGTLDLRPYFAAFRLGGTDLPEVRKALAALKSNAVDPRLETGQQIVAFANASDDRRLYVGVLRMDATKKGVLWIDQEPIELSGERYFDIAEVRPSGI